MFIRDLEDISDWYYLDGRQTYRAIGWLGNAVPVSGPRPSGLFQTNLRQLVRHNYIEDNQLGAHTCELCARVETHGCFYVEAVGLRYLAPLMLEHYIVAHGYRPPEAFIAAVEAYRSPAGVCCMTATELKERVQMQLTGGSVTTVEEFTDAFAVHFVNDAYLESGDPLDLEVGAGPALYIKASGELFWTGSGRSTEEYLEAYRACGDIYGEPGDSVELFGFAPESDTRAGILALQAILGIGLSAAKRLFETMAAEGAITVTLDSDWSAAEAVDRLTDSGFTARRHWRKTIS